MAMRRAVGSLLRRDDLAEGLGYTLKRRLLGKPLINEQLGEQRLSKRLALGVLSPDGISSSAYGTEEILIELLRGGLGGHGVHADPAADRRRAVRHGPGGAVLPRGRHDLHQGRRLVRGGAGQLRPAGGPDRGGRAADRLRRHGRRAGRGRHGGGRLGVPDARSTTRPCITLISIGVVLLMLYVNLRGIREAGKAFAVPTYLFSAVVIIMIIVGPGAGDLRLAAARAHPAAGADVYGADVTQTTAA